MKIIARIIPLLLLILCVGCKAKAPDVEVNEIITNVEEAVPDLAGLSKVDISKEAGTAELLGLNQEDIQEGVMMKPEMALSAMEVIVIKAKDEASANNIKASLQEHVEQLKQMYGGYGEEEMKKIEDCIIKTNNNYVLFAVFNQPQQDQIEEAFDKSIQAG